MSAKSGAANGRLNTANKKMAIVWRNTDIVADIATSHLPNRLPAPKLIALGSTFGYRLVMLNPLPATSRSPSAHPNCGKLKGSRIFTFSAAPSARRIVAPARHQI
jgi:hypothetical protein